MINMVQSVESTPSLAEKPPVRQDWSNRDTAGMLFGLFFLAALAWLIWFGAENTRVLSELQRQYTEQSNQITALKQQIAQQEQTRSTAEPRNPVTIVMPGATHTETAPTQPLAPSPEGAEPPSGSTQP